MALPLTGTKPLAFKLGATSDVDDNFECDSCRLQDVTVEARTYCAMCKIYMCSECKQDHQKADDFKSHTIVSGKTVPNDTHSNVKDSIQSREKRANKMTSCDRHVGKMVEFYCSKHMEVFCKECKEYKHFQCPDVNDIKTLAKGIKSKKDLTKTIQEVRKMLLQFEKLKTYKEAQDDRMEERLAECMTDIRDLRVHVNTILDTLERRIKSEIETRAKKEFTEIRNVRNECAKRVAILQEESRQLEEIKSKDESKGFVTLLHAQHVRTECDTVLQKLLRDKKEWHIEFEPNHKLLHFLKTFDSFGSIKATLAKHSDASGIFAPTPLPSMDVPSNLLSTLKRGKELVHSGEHVIHSADDSKTLCSITGATFLADGRLLLADNRNLNVKLFDQAIQLKSSAKLSNHPCDIAALNNREAVVTVPDNKQLHFLIMDPEIRLARTVNTELGCHGISVLEKGLLVTCYSHGVFGLVMLLDLQGRVKQRFDRDVNGDSLFRGPFFIAPNQKRDRFYVSDKAANKLLCVSTGGKIVFSYESKVLDAPGYITVDKEGTVFICGRDSKNVHMISSQGRKIKIFPTDEGEGSAICYRASDGLMVICSCNSDRVKTYKLL